MGGVTDVRTVSHNVLMVRHVEVIRLNRLCSCVRREPRHAYPDCPRLRDLCMLLCVACCALGGITRRTNTRTSLSELDFGGSPQQTPYYTLTPLAVCKTVELRL